jgi:type II secretory pathway component PulK
MRSTGTRRISRGNRRGSMLVIVMVLLLVVAGVVGALVQVLHVERRQIRSHDARLQAAWLAEAGLERAAGRLRSAADYEGETWTVPAGSFGGAHGGSVEIRVEPVAASPQLRRISVTADYPADPERRKRKSRERTVQVTD